MGFCCYIKAFIKCIQAGAGLHAAVGPPEGLAPVLVKSAKPSRAKPRNAVATSLSMTVDCVDTLPLTAVVPSMTEGGSATIPPRAPKPLLYERKAAQ